MNYRASERKAMLASTEKAASAIHASMEMAESRSKSTEVNAASLLIAEVQPMMHK